MHILSDPR